MKLLSTLSVATLVAAMGGLMLAPVTTADAATLDDIVKRGELHVAVQTQGPPFSFMDKNGERTGSAVELAKLIGAEMGVKVVFLDFDWDGLLPALMSGKADMLAADMTPTLARATKVAFTKPFMYAGSVVFAKGDGKFDSIEACKAPGTRIAVLFGSTGEKLANAVFTGTEIKAYKGAGTLLLDALSNGQADCAVNDSSSVNAQVSTYEPGAFKIMPEMLSKEPLAFATRYDSMDLLTWVNLFIDQTSLDGRLQGNLDYWVNSNQWKDAH